MTPPHLTRHAPTPADDLTRRALEHPSATAVAWDGGQWSYRELDAHATALAARLHALGAARGEAATLCATPGPEVLAALFALWRAGAIAVPLHERLTPPEVEYARETVMSTLHIDNSALHAVAGADPLTGGWPAARPSPATAPPSTARPSPTPTPPDAPPTSDASAPPPPPAPDPTPYAAFLDLAAFILTSGSSGAPKAVGFTRDAFAASAAAVTRRLGLGPDDRWGLCLSPGHIGGLSLVVRAVMTGSSVRTWPRFDPGAVARAVQRGEVTHLAVVPVMLRRLLAHLAGRRVPATLRCVLVGGAAAPPALLREAFGAGLPVATTWGMTETASQIATAPPELARRHPGTAGRPLHGVEVRRDPSGTFSVRGPTLAQVVVRGPGMPPEPLATDADGCFATRDFGRMDADGLLWIEGRAGAIIVSGGLNVSPHEVERAIETLPGVRDAVVFGLPDGEWGEVVAAVVEGDGAAVTAGDIDRHCRERLARGRCPSRIVVVETLPRTWTGKVIRARVREEYGPGLAGSRPLPQANETKGETR